MAGDLLALENSGRTEQEYLALAESFKERMEEKNYEQTMAWW
jgi:hypothetical protein